MTEARLNEILSKAENEEISNNELLEVMAATLKSLSRHSKDIKSKIDKMEEMINGIKGNSNYFESWGKIIEDPDQEWSGILSAKLKSIRKGWSVS